MKLGTDPELFVFKNDKLLSAYQALGGDCEIELPFGTLVPDGAAIEFTVQPADDPAELTNRVFANINATRAWLEENHRGAAITLSAAPVVDVKDLIADHPPELGDRCSLQIYGCNPDFSIYGTPIKRPNPKTTPFRSSGGHIHIELPTKNIDDAIKAVTCLDATVGLASVFCCQSPAAKRRKRLYGIAGSVRFTKLPILEYRVPPAQMIVQDKEVAKNVFAMALEAAMADVDKLPEREIAAAINAHDLRVAYELFKKWGVAIAPQTSTWFINNVETIVKRFHTFTIKMEEKDA